MPGIIGINKVIEKNLESFIEHGRDMLTYSNTYVQDEVFSDEHIICTRSHLGIIGEMSSPINSDNIFCWLEGEAYNLDEIKKDFDIINESFPKVLIEAYKKKILINVLNKIDGYFIAVLYDKEVSIIKIITDRFGIKPIYIWNEENIFSWCSELKGFLSFNFFKPIIEPKAIDCFLFLGHLLGDITWFKNVKLLGPSTILTYNLIENKIIIEEKYWNWKEIKKQDINFEDAVKISGNLLINAVRKRVDKTKKIGVSLSGGLDSRSIVASLEDLSNIKTMTFGSKNSLDLKIAKMVSKKLNVKHIFLEINEENWLEDRLRDIWHVDGMLTLMDMHISQFVKKIRSFFEINLNGFVGDILYGGSYVYKPDSYITMESAKKKFGEYYKLDDLNEDFYDFPAEDPYFIHTRVRRFTNMGSIEYAKFVEQRKPFIDNKLVEFLYSLPDTYRKDSLLYKASLLFYFPDLYKKIPWQRTGIPIIKKYNIVYKAISYAKLLLNKVGLYKTTKYFADYGDWIRKERYKELFREVLDPKKAIYPEFIKEDFLKKYLEPHLNHEKDYTNEICRTVSMEIWFQQVFNKKYLDSVYKK